MKPILFFDIINALALVSISAGSAAKWGWEIGAIVGGAVALAVSLFLFTRLTRR